MTGGECPGFLFCLIYLRLGVKETRNPEMLISTDKKKGGGMGGESKKIMLSLAKGFRKKQHKKTQTI